MTTAVSADAPAGVAEFVQRHMARWDVAGMQAAVLKDGHTEVYAFGVASIETGQPVRPDTIFQIGSITKVFTATLVMQLVDEGRIDLDAPVSDYLPDLRLADMKALQQITLRMILAHVGGFFGDRFDDTGMGDDALARFVAGFGTLAQITPPGAHFSYCNTGFAIAGHIVERMRGMPYERVLRKRLFEPLHMTHAFIIASDAMTYPLALGHNTLPGKEIEIARRYPLPRSSNPAGGVLCPAGDLLRFAQMHLNDGDLDGERILSPEAARQMREPQYPAGSFAEHYGIGWMLRTFDGVRVVGHGGSTNGFRAQLAVVPERNVALALLTNGSQGRAVNYAVEKAGLARFAGLNAPEKPRLSLPAEELARFAGRYTRPLNRIDVTVQDGGLVFAYEAESPLNPQKVVYPPARAEAIRADQFLFIDGENEGETAEFIDGPDGAVRFVRYHGRLADRVG